MSNSHDRSSVVTSAMYRTFRHEAGTCFTCPRCGDLEGYVNTDALGSITTDCGCGSKVHHFINDIGKPVYRLIPTSADLKYMEAMPRVEDHTYHLAKYNRDYWIGHVDDVPADY